MKLVQSPYLLSKCSVNHSCVGVCQNPPLPVCFLSSEVYICPLQIMYSSDRGIASRIGRGGGGGGGRGKCNWSGGLAIKCPCYHVGGGVSWQPPNPTWMHCCPTPSPFGQVVIRVICDSAKQISRAPGSAWAWAIMASLRTHSPVV